MKSRHEATTNPTVSATLTGPPAPQSGNGAARYSRNKTPIITVIIASLAAASLAGCAVVPPNSPTVVAMPGRGVGFRTFSHDDAYCRSYADQLNNSASANAASQSATNTAIGGTLLGTAAGALLGAATGNAGVGAAIGAGSGLLLGSAAAGGGTQNAADSMQSQYNVAYAQCMVAHGNKMEGYASSDPTYGVTTPYTYAPTPAYGYAPTYGYGYTPNPVYVAPPVYAYPGY